MTINNQRKSWTEEEINEVWEKGQVVYGVDSTKRRKDICGAWISRDEYGKDTPEGWEIDHIVPLAKQSHYDFSDNEINSLHNLQPLHYKNNVSKDESFFCFHAAVIAEGDKNVDKEFWSCVDGWSQIELVLSNTKLCEEYFLIES